MKSFKLYVHSEKVAKELSDFYELHNFDHSSESPGTGKFYRQLMRWYCQDQCKISSPTPLQIWVQFVISEKKFLITLTLNQEDEDEVKRTEGEMVFCRICTVFI